MEEKTCTKCWITKPLSEFYKRKANKFGYTAQCKQCVQLGNRKTRIKRINNNTDERISFLENSNITKQCLNCHTVKPLTNFDIRRSELDGHNSYCKECSSQNKRSKYHGHKKLSAEEYRLWRNNLNEKNRLEKRRLKTEIFSHYCPDGIIKCANPFHIHNEDITDLDILTLDHINGDGYKDRNAYNKRGGVVFYRKIKLKNYPSGFQILCGNCQMKKNILNKEYGEKYKQERAGF